MKVVVFVVDDVSLNGDKHGYFYQSLSVGGTATSTYVFRYHSGSFLNCPIVWLSLCMATALEPAYWYTGKVIKWSCRICRRWCCCARERSLCSSQEEVLTRSRDTNE